MKEEQFKPKGSRRKINTKNKTEISETERQSKINETEIYFIIRLINKYLIRLTKKKNQIYCEVSSCLQREGEVDTIYTNMFLPNARRFL